MATRQTPAAFRQAILQSTEMRRRKTRDSRRRAERLWFAMVMQALSLPTNQIKR